MYVCTYTLIDITPKWLCSQAWWYILLIPTLRTQKQMDLCAFKTSLGCMQEHPGLHRERDLTTKQKGKMIAKTSLNILDVYFYVNKFMF